MHERCQPNQRTSRGADIEDVAQRSEQAKIMPLVGILTICKQCNVPLCISTDGDDEETLSCNHSYHCTPLLEDLPYTP